MTMQFFIGTVIYLIGSISICVFYGLRWFNGTNAKSLGYSGSWPPFVNMCPDYFSVYTDVSGNQHCVDYVGFAKQGLNVYQKGSSPVTYPNTSANAIPFTELDTDEKKCNICRELGVTWEGVWDGQTCFKTVKSGGGGSGNC